MAEVTQTELQTAGGIAREVHVQRASNGLCYGTYGETNLAAADLEHILNAVPEVVAKALGRHTYYFVPLVLDDGPEAMIAPNYSVDFGDRAVCHRNVEFAAGEATFISTRLMQDRFALAFEFFINAGHHFVDQAGVPETFCNLIWAQAQADVRGETSQDAWEHRRAAVGRAGSFGGPDKRNSGRRPDSRPDSSLDARQDRSSTRNSDRQPGFARPAAPARIEGAVDEKARLAYSEAAFSDAIAIYLLSLTIDIDYADLREREYPLLAPSALSERLRCIAGLFPPNLGYEFQILYRRRG